MSGKKPSKKLLLKNKTIPFVYKWTQLSTCKWYIGSRSAKGCHPDDGYICSSELVFRLVDANPHDWKREILLIGSTSTEVRDFERALLKSLDARRDSQSYNCTNAESDFVASTKGRICITNEKDEKFIQTDEFYLWESIGWKKGRAKKHTTKISKTMAEVRKENNDWGVVRGKNNNKAKIFEFTSPDGTVYLVHGQMKEFCRHHGLSSVTVQVSLRQGWIPRRGKNAGWKVKDLSTGRETTRDTRNHGAAITGENNPYYGGKANALNKNQKDIE